MTRTSQPDDLLTALRAARPDPGYQPSPMSPEATALLATIMARPARRAGARHLTPRRLALAGGSALAATAVAVVMTSAGPSSKPASPPPPAASVRTAVLDAFDQSSGDIAIMTYTGQGVDASPRTQWWVYPAISQPGQQVRSRMLQSHGGAPVSDEETTYTMARQGPRDFTTISVSYASRTWYEGPTRMLTVSPVLSPGSVRDLIAGGDFTVAGRQPLHGRDAIKLAMSAASQTASGVKSVARVALWVDARSYEPLQYTETTATLDGKDIGSSVLQYQFLPATQASLALLIPPIPAGFTRTPSHAG